MCGRPRRLGRDALLLGLAVGLLAAPPAWAGFSVFPTAIDVRAKSSAAASGTFNVRLGGEGDHRFVVGVQDLAQREDGSLAVARPTGSEFSASRWVSVTPSEFSGAPGRVQPIEYTVRVPRRAEPGDHLASLTVSRLPPRGGSTTAPLQAISVRILVRVPGKIQRSAGIASLEAPGIAGGNPVTVSTVIRNDGNVRLDFGRSEKGALTILSGSERKASLPFTGTLYPGQQRPFQLSWDGAPLFGKFRAVASVDVGGRTVRDSASIMVLPWRQMAALALIALAAIVLLVGRSRRRYRFG
jgi:hypothetical protein